MSDDKAKVNESIAALNGYISESINTSSEELNKVYDAMLSNTKPNKSGNIINILTDYTWSNNNSIVRQGAIPVCYVREFRQNLSTFAATLRFMLNGIDDVVGATKLLELIKDKIGISNEEVVKTQDKSIEYDSLIGSKDLGGVLDPYKYMYSYDKTNCLNYVFPYFENNYIDIQNSFGDTAQVENMFDTQMSDIISKIGNMGQLFNSGANAFSMLTGYGTRWSGDGIFIEKPKYFQLSTDQDKVNLKFTLYNTIKTDSWKNNYDFVTSFALRNLPYKVSIFRYKTPLFYEISIPGVKYMPVAFVSNFSATARGTKNIFKHTITTTTITSNNTTTNASSNIEVVIPEAWDIEITFTSLLYQSSNLLLAALRKGPTITVK